MRNTTTMLLIALALTIGCGKGDEYESKKTQKIKVAQVAVGDEKSLAPMAVDNQWVYTLQQGGSSAQVTMKVTDIRQTPDGDTDTTINVRRETPQGEVDILDLIWRTNDTGIYQVTTGADNVFDPPQLLIPFPLKKGNEFQELKQAGTGMSPLGVTGTYKSTVTVLGAQEIDTDSGRMSAIAVKSVTEWDTEEGPAVSVAMTWWSPDIGFVRQSQEIRATAGTLKSVLKLKSHSFPRRSQ